MTDGDRSREVRAIRARHNAAAKVAPRTLTGRQLDAAQVASVIAWRTVLDVRRAWRRSTLAAPSVRLGLRALFFRALSEWRREALAATHARAVSGAARARARALVAGPCPGEAA